MEPTNTDTTDHAPEEPVRERMWARARQRRRRFQERYEQRRAERHHRLVRPVRIAAGILLILIGIAIGWLPGPGFIIFALPGAFLLASEIRRAAILLDRVEEETIPRLRRLHARLRGGPKPEWVEQDPHLWGITHDRRRAGDHADSGERRRRSDLDESSG